MLADLYSTANHVIEKIPVPAVILIPLGLFVLKAFEAVVGESLGVRIKQSIFKIFRSKQSILTKDAVDHRMAIRAEVEEGFRKNRNKPIEIIMSDALRGGRTYNRNRKFLGLFKRYDYHKVHIAQYFDDGMYVGFSILRQVRYSRLRGKWVPTNSAVPGSKVARLFGELSYDHIVKIDWEPSTTHNVPTLYYNCPFSRMVEREFYMIERKDGSYEELANRSLSDSYFMRLDWVKATYRYRVRHFAKQLTTIRHYRTRK